MKRTLPDPMSEMARMNGAETGNGAEPELNHSEPANSLPKQMD
jgi:hypothetical protein